MSKVIPMGRLTRDPEVRCQFLIGTVQHQDAVRNLAVVCRPLVCQFLIGTVQPFGASALASEKVLNDLYVSIPYRYGTTHLPSIWITETRYVSIPYRYGTTSLSRHGTQILQR